jgi:hypothetical protein
MSRVLQVKLLSVSHPSVTAEAQALKAMGVVC